MPSKDDEYWLKLRPETREQITKYDSECFNYDIINFTNNLHLKFIESHICTLCPYSPNAGKDTFRHLVRHFSTRKHSHNLQEKIETVLKNDKSLIKDIFDRMLIVSNNNQPTNVDLLSQKNNFENIDMNQSLSYADKILSKFTYADDVADTRHVENLQFRYKKGLSARDVIVNSQTDLLQPADMMSEKIKGINSMLSTVSNLYHNHSLNVSMNDKGELNVESKELDSDTSSASTKWITSRKRQPHVFDSWTAKDIALFENGLTQYGKQFHLIQRLLGQSKSVKDCVDFFYEWRGSSHYYIWSRLEKVRKSNYFDHKFAQIKAQSDLMNQKVQDSSQFLSLIK
jgi:hypothetical protein